MISAALHYLCYTNHQVGLFPLFLHGALESWCAILNCHLAQSDVQVAHYMLLIWALQMWKLLRGETTVEGWQDHNILFASWQVKAMSIGLDNVTLVDEDLRKKAYQTLVSGQIDAKDTNLGVGMKQFEAWMRMLDSLV